MGALPGARVDDAILEFRRFLGLVIVGYDGGLSLCSAAVDEVWHTCVLFTRLYADLCEQTVGHFVHHVPCMGETGDDGLHEGEHLFEQVYSRVYGEMTTPQALLALTDEQLAGTVGGGGSPGGVLCTGIH
jgi:hypothetical protein